MAPIAYNVEGRSADSGNLGPSQMELEEELKKLSEEELGTVEERDFGVLAGRKT